MKLVSTRGNGATPPVPFAEALFRGLAPDGGLYLPDGFPPIPRKLLERLPGGSFADTGVVLARHLLEGVLPPERIEAVVRDALDFPVPLIPLEDGIHLAELFHGPTLAFKDVGARFMARMSAALRPDDAPRVTILVATSGDTGGAVADAFHGVPGTRVVVLFPRGRVSPRQEAQFTTLGGNVTAVEVEGAFDDCQRLVKEAFADPELRRRANLSSANSINIGRLVPQIFYYAHAWAAHPAHPEPLTVSVPSGNFGNLTAGLMGWKMGIPVRHFVAATNVNDVVPAYLATGSFAPRPSVATLSNAMDVGDPSNFERMRHLFRDDADAMRGMVTGSAWSDEDTTACIADAWRDHGVLLDPHTAVGVLGMRARRSVDPRTPGVVLATAHPAKFAETVEPLIGAEIPLPPALSRRLDARRLVETIPSRLDSLRPIIL